MAHLFIRILTTISPTECSRTAQASETRHKEGDVEIAHGGASEEASPRARGVGHIGWRLDEVWRNLVKRKGALVVEPWCQKPCLCQLVPAKSERGTQSEGCLMSSVGGRIWRRLSRDRSPVDEEGIARRRKGERVSLFLPVFRQGDGTTFYRNSNYLQYTLLCTISATECSRIA